MSSGIPANPSGTLILQDDEGQVVQYSLEGIEAEFQSEFYGSVRVEFSARMGGENFVDLAPEVKTVADLALRHVGITRVRITTKHGVHEGYLDSVEVESVELYHSLQRPRVGRGLHVRLCVGGADFIASDTDLAEVIEEEKA